MDIPDIYIPSDIKTGLVLHLDPQKLKAKGGKTSVSQELEVDGCHFFLCISVSEKTSRWVPLYKNPGHGRSEIPSVGRTGHPKWTTGKFHFHAGQVWEASPTAIMEAAKQGGDMSRNKSRNMLDENQVPNI